MASANTSEESAESDSGAVPRRLWSGTALQVAGRVYGALCTFAGLAILARVLQPSDFGRFTFYLAAFALLDAAVDLGTGAVAVRRSSADRWATAPVLISARALRLRFGLLGFAAVGALAWALDEPDRLWITAAALYPITHVWELSATVFKNRMAWGVPVAIRAVAATLRLSAIGALALLEIDRPGMFLAATAAASALANLALHRAASPHLPKPTIPVRPASGVLREAWPLGVALVCQQLYFYVDNAFVRAIAGEGELGLYNAAVRLLSVAIIVAQYASATGLPWLVRRGTSGDLGPSAARLAQPLTIAAAFAVGLLLPHAEELLALVYGEPFRPAAAALRWLLVAVIAIHVGAVLLTAVVSIGRPRAVLAITIGGLGLNVALNALLVPRVGIVGAAQATAATEAAIAVGSLLALRRDGGAFLGHRPLLWLVAPLAMLLGHALSLLVVP